MANTMKNKGNSKKRKETKKSTRHSSSDQKENRPKNKVVKPDRNDGIEMSKQLLAKKTNNVTKRRKTSANETRVCGNGKALPSLADLEKMFEDSDDENNSSKSEPASTQKQCVTSTPEKPIINNENLMSPKTIAKISEKVIDLISNISHPMDLLEHVPPPPVISQKKRKRNGEPYIVGCKDRPKVPDRPSNNFCIGHDDYGIPSNCEDADDLLPKKRAKKSKLPGYSKSIFNAKSDEIAEELSKDQAEVQSDDSSDSNKTIEYFPIALPNCISRSFSPLPSTSRDNEIFTKNDELFNESLRGKSIFEHTLNSDTEFKNEESGDLNSTTDNTMENEDRHMKNVAKSDKLENTNDNEDVQVLEPTLETITIDDLEPPTPIQLNKRHKNEINNDDDCVIIVDAVKPNTKLSKEPIVIVDDYSNIDLSDDINIINDSDVIDDIFVNELITENNNVINKWKKVNQQKIDSIIEIDDTIGNNSNIPKQINLTSESTVRVKPPKDNSNRPFNNNLMSTNTQASYSNDITILNNYNKPDVTNISNSVNTTNAVNTQQTNNNNNQWNSTNLFITDTMDSIQQLRAEFKKLHDEHMKNLALIKSQSVTTPKDTSPSKSATNKESSGNNGQRNFGDCPICMDPLLPNSGIASTMCGHVFCVACIKAAIKANGRRCPTCRKHLKGAGGGYHLLYL